MLFGYILLIIFQKAKRHKKYIPDISAYDRMKCLPINGYNEEECDNLAQKTYEFKHRGKETKNTH